MKKGISIFLCLLLLLIMLVGCGGEKTQILGDITFTYNSTETPDYFPVENENYPTEYFRCSPKSGGDIAVYAYHLSDYLDDNAKEDLRIEKVEEYLLEVEGDNSSIHDFLTIYKVTEEDFQDIVPGVTVKIGSTDIHDVVGYRDVSVASFVYKNAIYLVTFEMRCYGNEPDYTDKYLAARNYYFELLGSIETK